MSGFFNGTAQNIVGSVVGGVILIGVGAAIGPIRRGVGRFFRWVGTIRVTTTKRLAAKIPPEGASEVGLRTTPAWVLQDAEEMRQALNAEIEKRDVEIQKLRMVLNATQNDAKSAHRQLELALAKPRVPDLPLPPPRWRVIRPEGPTDGTNYALVNSMPRSVAREVHIANSSFQYLLDAGHWENLSGETRGSFRATGTTPGWSDWIEIEWYDERSQKHEERVPIPDQVYVSSGDVDGGDFVL